MCVGENHLRWNWKLTFVLVIGFLGFTGCKGVQHSHVLVTDTLRCLLSPSPSALRCICTSLVRPGPAPTSL